MLGVVGQPDGALPTDVVALVPLLVTDIVVGAVVGVVVGVTVGVVPPG